MPFGHAVATPRAQVRAAAQTGRCEHQTSAGRRQGRVASTQSPRALCQLASLSKRGHPLARPSVVLQTGLCTSALGSRSAPARSCAGMSDVFAACACVIPSVDGASSPSARVCCQSLQRAWKRIDVELLQPRGLVSRAMKLAVIDPAKGGPDNRYEGLLCSAWRAFIAGCCANRCNCSADQGHCYIPVMVH
jgi:hypothetical protein